MKLELKLKWTGKEKFLLPPKQSHQYLAMARDGMVEQPEVYEGHVVCRVPREYIVSGKGEGIIVEGFIMEHESNKYSFFVDIKGTDWRCGYTGERETPEECFEKIKEIVEKERRAHQT